MLQITPLKTAVYRLEDNFDEFLIEQLKGQVSEQDIVAVTSKIVSLGEGRVVAANKSNKLDLIKREADHYLGEIGYGCHLTIKNNMLLPAAGIDVSNSKNGDFILYPTDPFASAKRICKLLKQKFSLKELGVLLTDSHSQPLRCGVTGAALAYYGFRGIEDKVGEQDLFGRELVMTKINVADALGSAATMLMGEGDERQPLAVIKAPVDFVELDDNSELHIPLKEDLYWPLLKNSIQNERD